MVLCDFGVVVLFGVFWGEGGLSSMDQYSKILVIWFLVRFVRKFKMSFKGLAYDMGLFGGGLGGVMWWGFNGVSQWTPCYFSLMTSFDTAGGIPSIPNRPCLF